VTTDFYYSSSWQVLEERVGGQTTVQYVWSPVYVDALILRDRDTDADGTLDERLWVVQDANFNVTAVVDDSGEVVERYIYDPFGQATVLDAEWNVRSGGSAYDWLHLHQGGRYDVTSGLYHFRFRDYSPTLGRWTSLDPLRYAAGDVNLYRTVGNNPLNSLDPSGLFWYPGKYLIQLRREYYRGLELDRQINERRAKQGLPQLEPPPHWTSVAAAEIGDGLRIGLQANVNAAATATRSLVTLGFWAEPWEVWSVADEDRPYYEGGFLPRAWVGSCCRPTALGS
jgi:RHS repeat-associated protein